MIAYREAAVNPAREVLHYRKRIIDKEYTISLDLQVEASVVLGPSTMTMSRSRESREKLEQIKPWQTKALNKGFQDAVATGPLLQYPVVNSNFILHSVEISQGAESTLISSAMGQCVKKVLEASGSCLLEPVMRLEITTDAEMVSTVTQDLLRRRGTVDDVEFRQDLRVVTATAPLAELRGYSSRVRELTSGRAIFGMEFSRYEIMDVREQNKAIEEVTGFPPS
jgi:elongation factor G